MDCNPEINDKHVRVAENSVKEMAIHAISNSNIEKNDESVVSNEMVEKHLNEMMKKSQEIYTGDGQFTTIDRTEFPLQKDQSCKEIREDSATNKTVLPNQQNYSPFTYVVFDTETTDRGRNSGILQIAAGNDFNVYAQPRCEISDQASAVNMLRYDRGTNTMFHRGIPVTSKPIQEALLDFIEYLKKVPQSVLVGHNACNFDIPIVCNKMAEFKLFSEFSTHVFGFVDTLKISKRIFLESDVGNYKQENLVSKLLTNCTYQAHDAKEDVRVLTTLFTEKIQKEVLDEDLFHISFHDAKKNMMKSYNKNLCH
ncbi:Hypothetical predicted protein [Mytilus galloprovincialis]|uniref:Exonuclease domain-containing protein n=1 Tax=Mytilus galloprovincialis TaxID=29158 RepID=A0A8B6GYJ6_MYTGA|nr:Hypothetical predicted protein [Mytilus galloprovincialis]